MAKKQLKSTSKASLTDLVDKIKWEALQFRGSISKIDDSDVSIQFTKKVKNPNNNNSDWVRIRLGSKVLDNLGWVVGDRIFIAHDPDDHFTFLLSKVDSKNGFKLGAETGSTHSCIHFTWRDNYTTVKAQAAEVVDYNIYKKQLIFRANPS